MPKLLKTYLFPVLLIVGLLFALASGTIHITRSTWTQSTNEILAKTFKMSDSQLSLLQQQPFVASQWLSELEDISGELLVSPKNSWKKRAEVVAGAWEFLHIWMYNITLKDARILIKNLAKDGVKVNMILEDDKYGIDQNQSPRWRWIQVRNDSLLHTNFVHAKVLVSETFAILQTANLTFDGFNKQREYYVIVQTPSVVGNLKLLFDKDRVGKAIAPNEIHPNILFCPIDCRQKTIALLQSAKESIFIQNQYIEDDEIIWMLQSKRDLDVRVILPIDEKNEANSKLKIQNVKLLNTPRIHAKAILVDRKYLLISSINLSQNSFDNNREIGIIITNKDAIQAFLDVFNQDRNRATE